TPEHLNTDDVLDLLSRLVDRSLVIAEETASGETRYRLLETIRQYAARHLSATERALVAARHAAYFLSLAENAAAGLDSPEQGLWLARLDTELDNLRAAQAWALQNQASEPGCRLASALQRFWSM